MKIALAPAVVTFALGLGLGTVVHLHAVQAPAAQAGRGRGGMNFTEPSPYDFADHDGYVSLFDGKSLDGWDGNPKFWRVEDGAIVGESTPANPSGNSYIAYRKLEAHDFTLKFEVKVEGTGGTGLQHAAARAFRVANIPAYNDGERRTGEPELDDDRTAGLTSGPAASTPAKPYSENTPMRILAWRGQVAEGFGEKNKRLMGTIGDRAALVS